MRAIAVLVLTCGLAAAAQAGPALFEASFIWHGFGNDISSGAYTAYANNDWTAVPLGYDCQHTPCGPTTQHQGHPAAGTWTGSIGTGTPPKITMQQSDFTIALVPYMTGLTWGVGQCCRGFLSTYPPYVQSFTYATFVNAAGSFFANGGAVAAGHGNYIGGSGTGRYNNRTGMTTYDKGTWRIRAGKNAFGGAMALLGKYGATVKVTSPANPGVTYSGTSSWAMVPPIGRLFENTLNTGRGYSGYTPMGQPYWWNPYTKTNYLYVPYVYTPATYIRVVGVATLWTTGQVGALAKTGVYYTSEWRTGFDNRNTKGTGSIQLVTPTLTHWLGSGFTSHTAEIGILNIRFISADTDGDGVSDGLDNCKNVANAGALFCDTDQDGYGNACDADLNNDGVVDSTDLTLFGSLFTTTGASDADLNCDLIAGGPDYATFGLSYLLAPGPSGLDCAGTVPCP
jgi:hypothetical protein